MSEFRLYFQYVKLHFLAGLQYRGWPLTILTTVVFVLADPIDALAMLDRFGSLGAWSASRILLIYGMALMCFGLSELVARGLDCFPPLIRSGEFDRMLLRPRSLFLQAMTVRFHLNRVTRVAGGGLIVFFTLRAQGVVLGPLDALVLLLAAVGGVLTYMGAFVISCSVAFFTVAPVDWINIFTNGSNQVAKLPPQFLPGWIRSLFLYIFPMFPFCYYPAAAVCGWGEPYALGFLALPAGALFFLVSLIFWRFGARHYQSTGS